MCVCKFSCGYCGVCPLSCRSLQAQYEQKIADVLREVKQLESREQALQQQLQRNSAHKKLTVF